MSDNETIFVAPEMRAVPAIVTEPLAFLVTPEPSDTGKLSIGGGNLPGFGPFLSIGVQQPDGTVKVASIMGPPLDVFRGLMASMLARLDAGDFDHAARPS